MRLKIGFVRHGSGVRKRGLFRHRTPLAMPKKIHAGYGAATSPPGFIAARQRQRRGTMRRGSAPGRSISHDLQARYRLFQFGYAQ